MLGCGAPMRVLFSLMALVCAARAADDAFLFGQFPEVFQWGVIASTDDVASTDGLPDIKPNTTLLQSLGVTSATFEFDWSATGLSDSTVDDASLAFYNGLVGDLGTDDISVQLTLFPSKMPAGFKASGGWTNATNVDVMCSLADNVFQQLGDKASMWSTFSKPLSVAMGMHTPGSEGYYASIYNMLLTHSCVYHRYKNAGYTGRVGITLEAGSYVAENAQEIDVNATLDRTLQFGFGLFAEPLLSTGDFPATVRDVADTKLPSLTTESQAELLGAVDFVGVVYTGSYVVTGDDNQNNDAGFLVTKDRTGHAEGLRKLLGLLDESYANVDIYVTADGLITDDDSTSDKARLEWLRDQVDEVLKAIQLDDNSNIRGINVGSLVDTSENDGLYQRGQDVCKPKTSAIWYKQVVTDNGFEHGYNGLGGLPTGRVEFEEGIYYDSFPEDFIWSSATSAYQIEGGWDADGKGPSVWDELSHSGIIYEGQTGDVACDSYHKYMDDVRIIKNLGTKYYRFSLAWTRMMPNGTTDYIEQAGIDHYNNLINALIAEGVTPMITLFHWGLPLYLQNQGGWENETIVEHFKNYAKLCYDSFGDRVKYWITINEPKYAAMSLDRNVAWHNMMKAHAEAYHVYDRTQNGTVGLVISIPWPEPVDPYNPEDLAASERKTQFSAGWFLNPVLVNGDYPDIMKKRIAANSARMGLNTSKLPEFTEAEKQRLNGTYDWIGLNHYNAEWTTSAPDDDIFNDAATATIKNPDWLGSGTTWLFVTPFGLRKTLNWLKTTYNNVPIYITENGISDTNGTVKDYHRIHYYRQYINEVLKAMKFDGCNVKGYTAWSLLDNFEWFSGYSQKFGIIAVNFSDPERTRTPKASAYWYTQLISEGGYKPGYPGLGGRGTAPDYVGKFYYNSFPDDFQWGVSMETATDNDVALLRELKVDSYQFSLSWASLFPDGHATDTILQYEALIDELLGAGIEPVVMLHDGTLPPTLEEHGGWQNATTVALFTKFADFCFDAFGDKVKTWITIDDPFAISESASEEMNGTVNDVDVYTAGHNLLRAHAMAYRLYKSKYAHQNGKVGLSMGLVWKEPMDDYNPSDDDAAEDAMKITAGWLADPVFGSGDLVYPSQLRSLVDSAQLPGFTEEEMANISGSADFFGVSVFQAGSCSYFLDDVVCVDKTYAPWVLRKTLNWIKRSFGDVDIYVTGNGVSDDSATLDDDTRVEFFKENIDEVLKAIHLDGVNVRGYTVSSLTDGQADGPQLGLYTVDENKNATPKSSAAFYSHVIGKNGFTEQDLDVDIPHKDDFLEGTFPEGFRWATASASYQIEGAWNEGGKGVSIWDTFSHEGGHVYNNDTGDVAADGYHHYMEDVKLLRALRVTDYRFSIAWTRIYPSGRGTTPNPEGVAYYNNLIDALLKMDIKPLVTLYHWDLPQGLQDHGGWLNESTTDAFADYVDTCFSLFGDRVKDWITLNEPWVVAKRGFDDAKYAPGYTSNGTLIYQVGHNLILAHAKAFRRYEQKYRAKQHGWVGITLNCNWNIPRDPHDPADWNAAERLMEFACGWFKHPIFLTGDYPEVMKKLIDEKSEAAGLTESRLPKFTQDQKDMIKGSADFLGLNHYSTSRAKNKVCDITETSYYCDMEVERDQDPAWPGSGSSWLKVYPHGMRRILNYIKDRYNNIPVYITENGVTDNNGTVHDQHRIDYYSSYINEMMKAVNIDGCNVKIYVAWALVDFFEWSSGFNEKFGFYHVDLDDPARPRSPKDSAIWFRNLIVNNGFVNTTIPHEHDFISGTFPDDFVWSAATASYQIEGGYDEGGKGRSIWDTFSHTPFKIVENATGDEACDSYHKYPEDVNILRGMQINHYRFSIAWSRILPMGYGEVNQAGIDYYNNLIDMLISANIVPMVTLYHWDLPQAIEDLGGWPNRTTAELYENYADICFNAFGDRVKFWITLNEPWCTSFLGYGNGEQAPGVVDSGISDYQSAHTLILAHARAYRLYHRKYAAEQQGRISVTLNCDFATPKDPNNVLDVEAADRRINFHLGWFAHPIYVDGDYPPNMRFYIDAKSQELNITEPRLPTFTEEEKEMILGSHDFFGLNTYTTVRSANDDAPAARNYYNDMDVAGDFSPDWEETASSWLRVVPFGIRRLVNWIRTEYGDDDGIYITENGVSDYTGTLEDDRRVNFYKHYLNELMKAVNIDGVNVKGYTAWSLMDNYEWARGYSERFGLHYVNFSDPDRTRVPKASSEYYRELTMRNGYPEDPVPDVVVPYQDEFLYGRFPDDFMWSVSTAAFQVEGGWDADGKGVSIWDTYAHEGKLMNNATGDIACDTYHKFREDIVLLKNLKVTHYRFSVAWTRVLPDGTTSFINPAGIAYYNELIDALLDAGIKPVVTIHHWDLPQALEDVGGWANRTVVQAFADYCDVLFSNYGDRVKFWITHNEPWVVAVRGYEMARKAPGRVQHGYIATHHMILAHGAAYRLYDEKYKPTQQGVVGITLNHTPGVPKDPNSLADIAAAETYNQFALGWYANPIYGNGDYPDIMKWQIGNKSLEQGYEASRLPAFTEEEKIMMRGSADFLGYNTYTSVLVHAHTSPLFPANYYTDFDTTDEADPSWEGSGSPWLKITPWGMRVGLNWVKDHYNNVTTYITENGVSDLSGAINDTWRISYLRDYLDEVLKAIVFDDCDIRGYTHWSFLDNLEWMEGYTQHFGLHYVDFNDPDRPRTPKASAAYYRSVIEAHGFVEETDESEPDSMTTTTTEMP